MESGGDVDLPFEGIQALLTCHAARAPKQLGHRDLPLSRKSLREHSCDVVPTPQDAITIWRDRRQRQRRGSRHDACNDRRRNLRKP